VEGTLDSKIVSLLRDYGVKIRQYGYNLVAKTSKHTSLLPQWQMKDINSVSTLKSILEKHYQYAYTWRRWDFLHLLEKQGFTPMYAPFDIVKRKYRELKNKWLLILQSKRLRIQHLVSMAVASNLNLVYVNDFDQLQSKLPRWLQRLALVAWSLNEPYLKYHLHYSASNPSMDYATPNQRKVFAVLSPLLGLSPMQFLSPVVLTGGIFTFLWAVFVKYPSRLLHFVDILIKVALIILEKEDTTIIGKLKSVVDEEYKSLDFAKEYKEIDRDLLNFIIKRFFGINENKKGTA